MLSSRRFRGSPMNRFKTMLLTLWDQFVPNEATVISALIETKPIIIGARLKVVSYHGISLSTKASSSFVINPSTPEADILRNWAAYNIKELEDISTKKSYMTPGCSSTNPSIENVINIASIEHDKENIGSVRKRLSDLRLMLSSRRFRGSPMNRAFAVVREAAKRKLSMCPILAFRLLVGQCFMMGLLLR